MYAPSTECTSSIEKFPVLSLIIFFSCPFKGTHRKNTPSNKTQVFTKSVNIDIWVTGTFNQLFEKGSSYA